MSPALRAGSAAEASRLASYAANAHAFFQLRTPTGSNPSPLLLHGERSITKKLPSLGARNSNWRRRRDSNPRDLIQAKRFSRPPHSTTLPPLRVG